MKECNGDIATTHPHVWSETRRIISHLRSSHYRSNIILIPEDFNLMQIPGYQIQST